MKKIYYNTEIEREEILRLAKKEGIMLKEDAITIHGKYLVFDTGAIEKLRESKIRELESQIAGLQSAMAELTMMLSTPQ